jgi:hypothetical protein
MRPLTAAAAMASFDFVIGEIVLSLWRMGEGSLAHEPLPDYPRG